MLVYIYFALGFSSPSFNIKETGSNFQPVYTQRTLSPGIFYPLFFLGASDLDLQQTPCYVGCKIVGNGEESG